MTRSETIQRPQSCTTIMVGLPLMIVGLFIVVFALVNAPWPADFKDARNDQAVSHWQRMTGNDIPEELLQFGVERASGLRIRRILDALMYYMVFQAIVAIVGLAWIGERGLYWLLMISGIYGILYAAWLGILVGPILASCGFALVLWGAVFGWFSTQKLSEG